MGPTSTEPNSLAPPQVEEVGGERPARAPLLTKRTVVGIAIFVAVLIFFLTQTRLSACPSDRRSC